MGIVLFLAFGLFVGLVAQAALSGRQRMDVMATVLLGMVGSIVGGTIGSLVAGRSLLAISTGGVAGSAVGAIALMIVLTLSNRRTAA